MRPAVALAVVAAAVAVVWPVPVDVVDAGRPVCPWPVRSESAVESSLTVGAVVLLRQDADQTRGYASSPRRRHPAVCDDRN